MASNGMKITIKTQAAYDPVLRRMAKEAGVGIEDLAEIAVYNVIAIWTKEHGVEKVQGDIGVTYPPHDVRLPGRQPGDDVAAPAL
jgi:hypothetical protein